MNLSFCDQITTTTQLWFNSETSPQNVQIFFAAQSLDAPDNRDDDNVIKDRFTCILKSGLYIQYLKVFLSLLSIHGCILVMY
jgi:hypothetical protein